jgi:glycosyltransferase involved in cell wall biosynthesis
VKKVLIVSLEYVGAEMAGPGIRYYHFAKELAARHEVTLVVPNRGADVDGPFEVVERRSLGPRAFRTLLRDVDVVVAQHLSLREMSLVARLSTRTIYDLYVPFATENLGLHAGQETFASYRRIAYRVENLLQQVAAASGNSIICASERQRDFWLGVLASTGRLEVADYRGDPNLRDLIDVVPFGLEPIEPQKRPPVLKGVVEGIGEDDKVLLWGGGIWNWFDPLTLIRAIERLSRRRDDVKLYFLGMKHPNPAVEEMTMAKRAVALAEELGLANRFVFFNYGWIPYDERHGYFLEADLGVSAHFDSIETRLAFRTRMLDYFAAALPTVVTKGDALADLVEERGLGRTVDFGDVEGWADAIEALLDDPAAYQTAKERTGAVQQELAWPAVVGPLERLVSLPGGAVKTGGRVSRMVVEAYGIAGGIVVTNPRRAFELATRRWR